jgi:arginase
VPDRKVAVLGVPTSAGSHHAGQDRAPAALRAAGLVSQLQEAGLDVTDLGDVPGVVFTPDAADATARHLATVVQVASGVADAVAMALAGQRLPVVLGRDCTITLGVLDAMGIAHLLGLADTTRCPGSARPGRCSPTGGWCWSATTRPTRRRTRPACWRPGPG